MTEETTPALEADEEDVKATRLTSAQWEEIRTLWELGEIKLSQIVTRFGISRQAVVKHFKKNGVTYGSRKGEIKTAIIAGVATSTASAAVETFADKRKQRIEDTRQAHYQAADYLSRLTNKILTEAIKDKKPIASVKEDLRALRYASAIQEQALRMRLDVLNAHEEIDENELPTLVIEDLTQSEIDALRDKQDEDDMGDDALLEAFELSPEDEDDDPDD